MRVLIITPTRFPALTGNATDVHRIVLGLQKYDMKVHVLTPDEIDTAFFPDIIHIFNAYKCRHALKLNRPMITTMTGTDINIDMHEKHDDIASVLQRSSAVTFMNNAAYDAVRKQFPFYTSKFHVIGRSGAVINDSIFNFRKAFNISSNAHVFTVIGGIRPVKNSLFPVALLQKLRSRYPRIILAYVGPILDDEFGKSFHESIRSHDWIRYCGAIPRDDMKSVYCGSDVIINCSHSESGPNAIFEALLLGRPVMVSDIPGNTVFVSDEVNGFVFRDENSFIDKAIESIEGCIACIPQISISSMCDSEEIQKYYDIYGEIAGEEQTLKRNPSLALSGVYSATVGG